MKKTFGEVKMSKNIIITIMMCIMVVLMAVVIVIGEKLDNQLILAKKISHIKDNTLDQCVCATEVSFKKIYDRCKTDEDREFVQNVYDRWQDNLCTSVDIQKALISDYTRMYNK